MKTGASQRPKGTATIARDQQRIARAREWRESFSRTRRQEEGRKPNRKKTEGETEMETESEGVWMEGRINEERTWRGSV